MLDARVYDDVDDHEWRLGTLVRESPRDAMALFKSSARLGKGVYGEARALRDRRGRITAVVKLAPFAEKIYVGGRNCPMRPENAEGATAALLWRYVGTTGRSPHIVHYTTLPHAFSPKCRVHLLPYAELGSLKDFLCQIDPAEIEEMLRLALFQVTYTLVAIRRVFPRFRHNDLNVGNVLVYPTHGRGGVVEYRDGDRVWHTSREAGVRFCVGDFDYSCIPGLVDNSKAFDDEFSFPWRSIGSYAAPGCDLYVFLQHALFFVESELKPRFWAELEALWPQRLLRAYRANENDLRPMPADLPQLPSAERVLHSDLFACFAAKEGANVVERYAATPLRQDEPLPRYPGAADGSPPLAPRWRVPLMPWGAEIARAATRGHFGRWTRHPRTPRAPARRMSGNRVSLHIRRMRVRTRRFCVANGIPKELHRDIVLQTDRSLRAFLHRYPLTTDWIGAVHALLVVDVIRGVAHLIPERERALFSAAEWIEWTNERTHPKQLLQLVAQWSWRRGETN